MGFIIWVIGHIDLLTGSHDPPSKPGGNHPKTPQPLGATIGRLSLAHAGDPDQAKSTWVLDTILTPKPKPLNPKRLSHETVRFGA